MAYNVTALDKANTVSDIFVGLNANMNGALIILSLLLFGIVLIIGFKRYDTRINMIATGTIISLIMIPLIALELVYWQYIMFPVSLTLGGIIWKALSD